MKNSSKHFFSLLITKAILNLRSEAGRSYLGYAWWLLEPILHTLVFYLVFGIFLAQDREEFVPFLLTGLIPWTWFSRSVQNSMGSLRASQNYLANFRIHPMFFPMLELIQDLVKQVFTFAFLLLFLLAFGVQPTVTWSLLPAVVVLQFLLVVPIASFVASIIPLLEDLKYLVGTALMLCMFASGIFYEASTLVTDEWRGVFYANPMASLLQIYRDILLAGQLPECQQVLIVSAWAVMFALLTAYSMSKLRHRYALLVMQGQGV